MRRDSTGARRCITPPCSLLRFERGARSGRRDDGNGGRRSWRASGRSGSLGCDCWGCNRRGGLRWRFASEDLRRLGLDDGRRRRGRR